MNMRSLSLRCEDVFFIVRGEEKYIDDHRLRDIGRRMIRECTFNVSNMKESHLLKMKVEGLPNI